jgi:PUA domain protein
LLTPCKPPELFWSPQVEAGTPVAIYAEDKEHAMAVGLTTLSTQEMREVNKGIGVELMHHLNDALWKTTKMD